jgi:hypothetical protein
MRVGIVCLATLGLAACTGADDDPVAPDWCAAWHEAATPDGYVVAVCDEAFPEAPYVAVPEDRRLTVLVGSGVFVDASGAELGALAWDVAETEAVRHAFALYEVEPDGAGGVDAYAPVVFVDERRMLAPWLTSPLEGLVSRRTVQDDGSEEFELTPSVPLRLELEELVSTEDASLADGALRYTLRYRVANLDAAVTAADGSCLPSLRSYGEADAFHGVTDVVIVGARTPSMHGFGDDAMVYEYLLDGVGRGSVMGPNWYVGPSAAWSEIPAPPPYEGMGHGTPGSMPEIGLARVEGGGTPCDPTTRR